MVLASDTQDGTRYRLLETLRQFGEEQLVKSGDAVRIHERHVRFFTDYMTRAWAGSGATTIHGGFAAIGHEFENLRVAVYAAIDGRDREALAALLRPHMWWAWHALRYEVGDWAEAALAVEPEPALLAPSPCTCSPTAGAPRTRCASARGCGTPVEGEDPDADVHAGLVASSTSRSSPPALKLMRRCGTGSTRQGEPGNVPLAAATLEHRGGLRLIFGEEDEARRVAVAAYEQACTTGNQDRPVLGAPLHGPRRTGTLTRASPSSTSTASSRSPDGSASRSTSGSRRARPRPRSLTTTSPAGDWPRRPARVRSFINSGDGRAAPDLGPPSRRTAWPARDVRTQARSVWQELAAVRAGPRSTIGTS